jgi:hypothetical protein
MISNQTQAKIRSQTSFQKISDGPNQIQIEQKHQQLISLLKSS